MLGQPNRKPMLVLTNNALQPPVVNYSLNIATPLSVSPLVALSSSAEKQVSIHPLTTGLVIALPAPVGVRLGPSVDDKSTISADHTSPESPGRQLLL